MGYQALLFCPDEKMARVVSHVFSELDFAVELIQEPFAAVKKFMAQRYDAIVVDCENEANASLLFKSARNSSCNQSSLAIALVEGQAGVAKAYRIGANLVLTKPINVEQAKGTLRVARGLLRKNSDAANAAAPARTATSVTPGSSFQPASRGAETMAPPPSRPEPPESEAPLPTMNAAAPPTTFPAAFPAAFPAMTASAEVEEVPAVVPAPAAPTEIPTEITMAAEPAVEAWQPASPGLVKTEVVHNDGVKSEGSKSEAAKIAVAHVEPQNTSSAFTPSSGSAAAPAPAKEVTAPPAKEKEKESRVVGFEAAYAPQTATSDAPSFAALGEEESGGSGGKKILIAAVVVLALAALGYFGYGKLGKFTTPAPQAVSAPQAMKQPAPALSPVAAPSTSTSSATPTVTPKTTAAITPDKPSASAGNPPVIRIAATPEPEAKKPDSSPLRVKSNTAGTKPTEEPTPQLPSPLDVAPASASNLSGLVSASPNFPKPSLATLKVSQGVSQGLLIKRVQPKYPPAALAAHTQGVVQIEASINKEGNVINLKVLSGDGILAKAALEAVRQWRYKPYYLDGEPVEIQTQITINFKTN